MFIHHFNHLLALFKKLLLKCLNRKAANGRKILLIFTDLVLLVSDFVQAVFFLPSGVMG